MVVRKLLDNDNLQVMRFLKQDPEFNIFIIGDIEQFGYVCEFQTLWGEFEDNELKAVLLQYRTNLVYYSPIRRSIEPFRKILDSLNFNILNGKKEVIEVFEDYLSEWEIKDMYFASLREFTKENVDTSEVELLTSYDDFCDEFVMLEGIEEFSERMESMDVYAQHQEEITAKGSLRTYGLRRNGILVSVASVVAENSMNGMIVGVATAKEYRKKGLASVVMNKLCNEYLNVKNKSVCLFFDNPKAGSIYHRLGFKDIGMYRMYVKPVETK